MRSLSECKVMIVDDSESNIDLLVDALSSDYRISVAMDGESALEYAAESQPDLILLDILMPGMDGYGVIQRLKGDPVTSDIPVIFCTVMSEAEAEEKGLQMGAVDYICKPFNPPIVKARVKNHLVLRLAQESLKEQNAVLKENVRLREQVEHMSRHDIKSPLSALICLPGIMIEEGGLVERQVALLRMMEKSAYIILDMVNRSLDLYKMETGTYQFHPEPVELLRLLRHIFEENRGLIMAKSLSAAICVRGETACAGDEFLVSGEEMLCYSMLANLIQNAFEASPKGCAVLVTLDDSNSPVVKVHNQGVVPEDIKDRFFDKYVTSGKACGTGLGTYSAALIAKTLGGGISFETSEENGTTVTVELTRG